VGYDNAVRWEVTDVSIPLSAFSETQGFAFTLFGLLYPENVMNHSVASRKTWTGTAPLRAPHMSSLCIFKCTYPLCLTADVTITCRTAFKLVSRKGEDFLEVQDLRWTLGAGTSHFQFNMFNGDKILGKP